MKMALGRTIVLLSIFGFLKEFRPSESFVTQYLLGPSKNFTKAQVNQEIYPVGTYSNLSLLVVVFLITDWARYKTVIIIEGLAGVLAYTLLIWGQGVPTMQVVEFFYGLFMATDIAYKTYMYAMCDVTQYQMVSACVQAAVLSGRFLSGVVSQISISFNFLSYHQLNFLTLSGVILAVPFACFLPSVNRSLYFHNAACKKQNSTITEAESCNVTDKALQLTLNQSEENETDSDLLEASVIASENIKKKREGVKAIIDDFLNAYSNRDVLIWSLWWSLGTCGYLQVTSYIQILWEVTVEDSNQKLLNGAIDAAYTIIGTVVLWFLGFQKTSLQPFSGIIIFSSCIAQGSFLLICSFTHHLWVQYVLYVMFKVLYHSVMVFASAELAKSVTRDSTALVFGFNTFVALGLQTVLTVIVAGKGGFRLKIRDQFAVYGSFFIILGLGFCLSISISAVKSCIHSISSSRTRTSKKTPNVENSSV